MRERFLRFWFWTGMVSGAFAAVVWLALPSANAGGGSANFGASTSVSCPPPHLYSPDGGAGKVTGKVVCPWGHVASVMENETANAVYLGYCPYGVGVDGCLAPGNRTVVGKKRCTTCNGGIAFSADVTNSAPLYCVSDLTTDAGVSLSVTCAR